MTTDDRDLDRSIAALCAELPAPAGGHFDADELFAYLAGELSEEAAERLRRHLEGCRRCLGLLLELEPLAAPDAPPPEGVADLELAAARRAITERLARERAAEDRGRAPEPQRPRLAVGWSRAAAAVFLAASLGLSLRVVQLERTAAELRRDLEQPRINVPVFYADATRAGGVEIGELPPGNDFFVLMLMPTELRVFASYEVEILDAGKRPVWSGEGLEMSAGGALRLGLPRRFLPPGRYLIRLYGRAGEERDLIEEYPLDVR